ncbi:MAG: hypothetical protein ACR2MB_12945 [Acidimicrobiales bacterium]
MAVAIGAVVRGGSAHLAAGLGSIIGIDPPAGPPGTPFRVTVTCAERPDVLQFPLDGGVHGTIPHVQVSQEGADVWSYDGVAPSFDYSYSASCGDQSGSARFDTDAPFLFLGPVPRGAGVEPFPPAPRTRIEGTDCPAGTTVSVTITVDGQATTHTAAIDQYGDWAVDLPFPAGAKEMAIDASCGAVDYDRFFVATTTTTTLPPNSGPTVTTSPTTANSVPVTQLPPGAVAPAAPAAARPGAADLTG